MSVSVGTDLIEIERIRRSLARYARFRERCFTEAERAYCDSRPNPAQSYAGRFAGKEAVGKALGFGVARAFAWQEVEIVGRPKPAVRLSGRLAERAAYQHDVGRVALLVQRPDAERAERGEDRRESDQVEPDQPDLVFDDAVDAHQSDHESQPLLRRRLLAEQPVPQQHPVEQFQLRDWGRQRHQPHGQWE